MMRIMTLNEFLTPPAAKMTKAELAQALNVSVITVNRWIAGTRFPEREMVLRIEEATHGCVKPADWYVPRKPAPQQGAAA